MSFFFKVQNREVLAMKNAFSRMGDYSPKLTFITVQKRHNTRFYSEERMNRGTRAAVRVFLFNH